MRSLAAARGGVSELRQKLPRHDARRAARAPPADDAERDRRRLLVEQRIFIAGRDQTMADQQAGRRESVQVLLKRWIERAGRRRHNASSAIISPSSSVPDFRRKPKLA